MHPYLSRLGIPAVIQQRCLAYMKTNEDGNLSMSFGDGLEIFGPGRHLVPASQGLWVAGDPGHPNVRQLIIGHSAMELIAFLTRYRYLLPDLNRLSLVATGSGLHSSQLSRIRGNCEGKSCAFIFGNDLFGRIADIKAAAALRNLPLAVSIIDHENVEVIFRNQQFPFGQERLTLNALEKEAGFRFGFRTYKPKTAATFLAQIAKRTNP
jgi:hypothetical protein